MKVRFSIPAQWSPDYQQQVHGQIERAFDGIREYAIPPPGGAAGQVLTKNSATDYDFAWLNTGALTANYLPRTTDAWQQSTDNRNRFYFLANGRTYFGSQNGYEWRSAADATIGTLSNAGDASFPSVRSSAWLASGTGVYYGTSDREMLRGDDTWLRLNNASAYASGVYTPGALRVDGLLDARGALSVAGTVTASNYLQASDVRADGFYFRSDSSFYIYGAAGYLYGSWRIGGARGAYVGLVLDDSSGRRPTFMSNGSASGIYNQGLARWDFYNDGSVINTDFTWRRLGAGAHLYHAAGYNAASVTVSTSAPSGGSDGDIWLKI